MNFSSHINYQPPIIIGGIGGSGTRIIAEALIDLGVFMGNDLNTSNDNLLFTYLYKHKNINSIADDHFSQISQLFFNDMTNIQKLNPDHLKIIQNIFPSSLNLTTWTKNRIKTHYQKISKSTKWGWKEPNTHIMIKRLTKYFTNYKYIHVVRNGLDMAISSNQNQLSFWGKEILNSDITEDPYFSLKYWIKTHQNILKFSEENPNNVLIIKFEDFCVNTRVELLKLCEFLNIDYNEEVFETIYDKVNIPSSIGRYKILGTSIYEQHDIDYVNKIYFD